MSQDQFFPPIGQLAKKADDLSEELTTPDGDVQEDRPLEEVESLCMRCGEQVSLPSLPDRTGPCGFLLTPSHPDCRERPA